MATEAPDARSWRALMREKSGYRPAPSRSCIFVPASGNAARQVGRLDQQMVAVGAGEMELDLRALEDCVAQVGADALARRRDGAGRPTRMRSARSGRIATSVAAQLRSCRGPQEGRPIKGYRRRSNPSPGGPNTLPRRREERPTNSRTKAVRASGRRFRASRVADGAAVHHRDAVGHGERLVLVVGDEDRRGAELAQQAPQLDLHGLAQLAVERGERLVEQHQSHIACPGPLLAGARDRSGRGARRARRRGREPPRGARTQRA